MRKVMAEWPPVEIQVEPLFRVFDYSEAKVRDQDNLGSRYFTLGCYFDSSDRTVHFFCAEPKLLDKPLGLDGYYKLLSKLRSNIDTLNKITDTKELNVNNISESLRKIREQIINLHKSLKKYYDLLSVLKSNMDALNKFIGDEGLDVDNDSQLKNIIKQIIKLKRYLDACSNDNVLSVLKSNMDALKKFINTEELNVDNISQLKNEIKLKQLPEFIEEKISELINFLELSTNILFRITTPYDWYENGIAYELLRKINQDAFFYLNKLEDTYNEMKGYQEYWQPPVCFYMRNNKNNNDERKVYILHRFWPLISRKPIKDEENPNSGMENNDDVYYVSNFPYLYSVAKDLQLIYPPDTVKDSFFNVNMKMREHLLIPLSRIYHSVCDEGFNKFVHNDCIVIPIYDIYVNQNGYGSIQGFYIWYAKRNIEENERNDMTYREMTAIDYLVKRQLPDIIQTSESLFMSKILRIREENFFAQIDCTFIDYFLQVINSIQNWEKIWITKHNPFSYEDQDEFSRDSVTHYWKRKYKAEKHLYEWVNCFEENEDKAKEEAYHTLLEYRQIEEPASNQTLELKCPSFSMQFIKSLLRDEDQEYYGDSILNHYIIFRHSDADITRLPRPADNFSRVYLKKVKEKQFRIFEMVIRMWYQDKDSINNDRLAVNAKQASHNLGHLLGDVIQKKLPDVIKKYEELSKKEIIRMGSSTTYFEKTNKKTNSWGGQSTAILDCRNLLLYMRQRLSYFANQNQQIEERIMQHFSVEKWWIGFQKDEDEELQRGFISFLMTSLTARGEGDNIKVSIEYVREGYRTISSEFKQPLYIFLENYIRNVVKYNNIADEEIVVYINFLVKRSGAKPQTYVQLWEKSKKETSAEQFYKDYLFLRELHKEIEESPLRSRTKKDTYYVTQFYKKYLYLYEQCKNGALDITNKDYLPKYDSATEFIDAYKDKDKEEIDLLKLYKDYLFLLELHKEIKKSPLNRYVAEFHKHYLCLYEQYKNGTSGETDKDYLPKYDSATEFIDAYKDEQKIDLPRLLELYKDYLFLRELRKEAKKNKSKAKEIYKNLENEGMVMKDKASIKKINRKVGGLKEIQYMANEIVFSKRSKLNVNAVSFSEDSIDNPEVIKLNNLSNQDGKYFSIMYEFSISDFPQQSLIYLSHKFLAYCKKEYAINRYGYYKNGIFIYDISDMSNVIKRDNDNNLLFNKYYFIVDSGTNDICTELEKREIKFDQVDIQNNQCLENAIGSTMQGTVITMDSDKKLFNQLINEILKG